MMWSDRSEGMNFHPGGQKYWHNLLGSSAGMTFEPCRQAYYGSGDGKWMCIQTRRRSDSQ